MPVHLNEPCPCYLCKDIIDIGGAAYRIPEVNQDTEENVTTKNGKTKILLKFVHAHCIDPNDPRIPVCKHLLRRGHCLFSDDCCFRHPQEALEEYQEMLQSKELQHHRRLQKQQLKKQQQKQNFDHYNHQNRNMGKDKEGEEEEEMGSTITSPPQPDQESTSLMTGALLLTTIKRPRKKVYNQGRCGVLRRWLIKVFGLDYLSSGPILDVAGGKGELACELSLLNSLDAVVIDPRPLQTKRFIDKFRIGYYHLNKVLSIYNSVPRPPKPAKGQGKRNGLSGDAFRDVIDLMEKSNLSTDVVGDGGRDGGRDGGINPPHSKPKLPLHIRTYFEMPSLIDPRSRPNPNPNSNSCSSSDSNNNGNDNNSSNNTMTINHNDSSRNSSSSSNNTSDCLGHTFTPIKALISEGVFLEAMDKGMRSTWTKKGLQVHEDEDEDEDDDDDGQEEGEGGEEGEGENNDDNDDEVDDDDDNMEDGGMDEGEELQAKQRQKIRAKIEKLHHRAELCGVCHIDRTAMITDFTHATQLLKSCSLIVSMHGDQGVEHAINFALQNNKPFAVLPCCVYRKQFPHRRESVRTYEELIHHLMSLHPDIKALEMDFEGKNILLYWLADCPSLVEDPSEPTALMVKGALRRQES